MKKYFERLLFAKIELWVVGLLAILGVVFLLMWASLEAYALEGGKRGAAISNIVVRVSTFFPHAIKDLKNSDNYLRLKKDPYPGRAGFSFSYEPGTRTDAGYLLLSRYDGDDGRSYVEYWDMNSQAMIHRWAPPIDEINAASQLESNDVDLARDKNVSRMLIRHPLVTDAGDIVIKSRTPLTMVDMCDEVVWSNDTDIFHHAMEYDADGFVWVATRKEPTEVPKVDPIEFMDDAITKVDANGQILMQISVSQLLIDNGLDRYVYGRDEYSNNPIHLNDVQPVSIDGPYWKRGDVFLSLRSHSLIVLYRPSNNKVLWYKEGPWKHQHDVDILDDHRISIFNNSSRETWPRRSMDGHSDVLVYDFATEMISAPWSSSLEQRDFATFTEGLHKIRSNGNLFAEEQNYGHLFELDPDGAPIWDYVNRAKSGDVYVLGWSRLLDPDQGKRIADTLQAQSGNCS